MKIFFLFLFLSIQCFGVFENTGTSGRLFARRYAKSIHTLNDLALHTDEALNNVIRVAVANLKSVDENLAYEIQFEWDSKWHGDLLKRDIGDHAPLSQWLADTYNKIEAKLGVELCKALHLSDLKTFNYCIPIVFRPCTYPIDHVVESRRQDYQDHFAMGKVYYGLVPVVTWWAMSSACWIGTVGVGAFVCSIATAGAEWAMGHVLCPPLSNRIFDSVCGTQNSE